MKVLMLDAYNLIHRARSGLKEGENSIVYNFFRSLRPLVAKFRPEVAYFVLEGYPAGNLQVLPEYKGNRPEQTSSFKRQKSLILDLVKRLPLTTVKHLNFECDDVLYSVVKNWHPQDDVTVVSTDTDFIQLYSTLPEVTLWNPVKKKVVPASEYDYVLWKALRGDKTDNVPGIPGVGDRTAEKLVRDPSLLSRRMEEPEFVQHLTRNLKVIQLEDLGDRLTEAEVIRPNADWEGLRSALSELGFASIVEDTSWDKFVKSFSTLRLSP